MHRPLRLHRSPTSKPGKPLAEIITNSDHFIRLSNCLAELKKSFPSDISDLKIYVRVRDLSEEAYRAGSITLTDVLDADRQLHAAQDDLDASRADATRAAVAVFRAFGGGWDAPL
jgi:Outer membrane efflux protein